MRVTTVDDDVTLLKVGRELVDEGVDGGAGLDEDDHLTRALELGNKLLDRVGGDDVGACEGERASAVCVSGRGSEVGATGVIATTHPLPREP